jgi:hypothetical protein
LCQQKNIEQLLMTVATYAHLSDNVIVLGTDGSPKYCGGSTAWLEAYQDTANIEGIETEDTPPLEEKSVPKDRKDSIEVATKSVSAVDQGEEMKRQTGDSQVWIYYAKKIGVWPLVFALIFVVVAVFSIHFPNLWLKYNTGPQAPNVGVFVGVFVLVAVTTTLGMAGML